MAAELPPDVAARLLPPEPKTKGRRAGAGRVPPDLSERERAVFKLLSTDEPAHIDALAEASRLSIPELTGVLLGLEMRDLVRQLPGKCFVGKM